MNGHAINAIIGFSLNSVFCCCNLQFWSAPQISKAQLVWVRLVAQRIEWVMTLEKPVFICCLIIRSLRPGRLNIGMKMCTRGENIVYNVVEI